MMKAAWKSLMDPRLNMLNTLPRTVRFQMMAVLASLWSAIFCASTGLMLWLPGYLVAHITLLLIGIFGTSWLFRSAQSLARTPARTAK